MLKVLYLNLFRPAGSFGQDFFSATSLWRVRGWAGLHAA